MIYIFSHSATAGHDGRPCIRSNCSFTKHILIQFLSKIPGAFFLLR